MKVLVTGGAGFIGSHVVDKLIQEKCQVVIIDNLSTGLRENINPAATFIQLDIRNDEIFSLFMTEKFDFVIHLAAQTMVHKSLEMPDYDCDINILGTVNILEACRKANVKRIIFSSTAAVYGNVTALPVVETSPKAPTSFYGLSKLTCENYLSLYKEVYGLDYMILRYANVYGDRQGDGGEGGVISIFARKIRQDQPVLIFGDGSQTRDFIYVGDVANANYQSLLVDHANKICNISTQTETSVNMLIDYMGNVAGKMVVRNYNEKREGDIYKSSLSNATARKNLDWQPHMMLLEGLAKTYHSLI
ncbi:MULTISPECIES: NAD-dependent epimerase/dehydratase family protein [Pelosinus]|uniref:NAD-dependent epimerase/dehydratase n=1 Tax=Pelosinus fermentans B4 TaxID=1149862 RepID=I8RJT5_9FIRM|nr:MULTISPECIES: NAD-dependent epimerase/dehydratase family protein [Pelosinus]EIW18510.1 NAD-dependent epimerase/dehydratase [Pelosinus fermentans B4]EIW24524.1 NAD-dependent epimerase/dehydratase [Pelosinus fermentans A11]OAM94418.1 UDP-glucose 4-epimerase [Pelosinus fermentans DSM 17108]SDR08592.1 UDP-glucose 4-epimerase [Pelosinus fermentans]